MKNAAQPKTQADEAELKPTSQQPPASRLSQPDTIREATDDVVAPHPSLIAPVEQAATRADYSQNFRDKSERECGAAGLSLLDDSDNESYDGVEDVLPGLMMTDLLKGLPSARYGVFECPDAVPAPLDLDKIMLSKRLSNPSKDSAFVDDNNLVPAELDLEKIAATKQMSPAARMSVTMTGKDPLNTGRKQSEGFPSSDVSRKFAPVASKDKLSEPMANVERVLRRDRHKSVESFMTTSSRFESLDGSNAEETEHNRTRRKWYKGFRD